MPPGMEGPALAAREVGRTALVAVHRVIPRAVTRAMNDTLDASGQGSVRLLSSRYRSRHEVSLPEGRRHTLVSGSTYEPGDRSPSSGCSTQDPDVSDWNFEASSVRERMPSLR
jgi:hypothetical protein